MQPIFDNSQILRFGSFFLTFVIPAWQFWRVYGLKFMVYGWFITWLMFHCFGVLHQGQKSINHKPSTINLNQRRSPVPNFPHAFIPPFLYLSGGPSSSCSRRHRRLREHSRGGRAWGLRTWWATGTSAHLFERSKASRIEATRHPDILGLDAVVNDECSHALPISETNSGAKLPTTFFIIMLSELRCYVNNFTNSSTTP